VAAECRVLGPVEAVLGGRVLKLGHARQRSVLAVLLVGANRVVSVDQLVERTWGTAPAARDPREALCTYLSRLRQVLARGCVSRGAHEPRRGIGQRYQSVHCQLIADTHRHWSGGPGFDRVPSPENPGRLGHNGNYSRGSGRPAERCGPYWQVAMLSESWTARLPTWSAQSTERRRLREERTETVPVATRIDYKRLDILVLAVTLLGDRHSVYSPVMRSLTLARSRPRASAATRDSSRR
jgi:hypothetical protein